MITDVYHQYLLLYDKIKIVIILIDKTCKSEVTFIF